MALYSLPAPAGYRAGPSGLLTLDARSDTLIAPGNFEMPLPTSDAEAVALGWPSIAGALDGDMWTCDEAAGNLVGKVNAYQLAPQNAPLQNRDFHGLPYGGSLWAKKAVESSNANQRFEQTANNLQVGNGVDFSLSTLFRANLAAGAVNVLAVNWDTVNTGWELYHDGAALGFYIKDGTGATGLAGAPAFVPDGSLHLLTISCDRDGNLSWYLDAAATTTVAMVRPGDLSGVANRFSLLGRQDAILGWATCQPAWAWHIIGVACDRTGHDALWAYLSSGKLGTPNTYTFTGSAAVVVPISASRVAAYSAAQLPVGYGANASATDNALRTGLLCDLNLNFEPIGSDDFYGNTALAGVTKALIDGVSGMRDGVRVTQTAAWNPGVNGVAYLTNAGIAIAGASNVPWRADISYKRATSGTNANFLLQFNGDGGGPEYLSIFADAASPVDWLRAGGAATPVGAAHNLVRMLYGGQIVGDDADFAEPALVKNFSDAPLRWCRVGTVASVVSGASYVRYTNVGNARYKPAQGRWKLRISGYQVNPANQRILVTAGPYGSNGTMALYTQGATLTMECYDSASLLVASISAAVLDANEHEFTVEWDSYVGKMSVMEGAVEVCSAAPGPWVADPGFDVTPITFCYRLGVDNQRCLLTLVEGFDY